MTHALVVDDEEQMLSIITFALETQGFTCDTAANAQQAWELVTSREYGLIILDIMLPDICGITLCEKIRANYQVPIIILSALGEDSDRLAGLEAGADDYIVKPFSPREVAFRAQAVTRRTKFQSAVIHDSQISMNILTSTVTFAGKSIVLPPMEAKLLIALMNNPGSALSHQQLLEVVWETKETVGGREMVKITVYRLRQHLKEIGMNNYVHSVRGIGYRTSPDQSGTAN